MNHLSSQKLQQEVSKWEDFLSKLALNLDHKPDNKSDNLVFQAQWKNVEKLFLDSLDAYVIALLKTEKKLLKSVFKSQNHSNLYFIVLHEDCRLHREQILACLEAYESDMFGDISFKYPVQFQFIDYEMIPKINVPNIEIALNSQIIPSASGESE